MRDTKALQTARANEPDPYKRRFTAPKWNRTVTVLDVPRLFARLPEFEGWTRERHDQTARDYMAYARAYDVCQTTLIHRGEAIYGANGALISGGFRNHWPEALKDAIRLHAHGATNFRDKAIAHFRAAGKRLPVYRLLCCA